MSRHSTADYLYIDMHCHILPGVDDGSKDMEMSLRMLEIAAENNIGAVIFTPHNRMDRHSVSVESMDRRIEDLSQAAQERGLDIPLYPGGELYYDSTVTDRLRDGKAPTLNNSRYCLVEFSPLDEFSYISEGLRRISYEGYQPILAHCERYACLTEKDKGLDRTEDLYRMGVYLQVNAASVVPKPFQRIPKYVNALLADELVSFVATDAHRDSGRAPYMNEAAAYLRRKYDPLYVRAILHDNAEKVIYDEEGIE